MGLRCIQEVTVEGFGNILKWGPREKDASLRWSLGFWLMN